MANIELAESSEALFLYEITPLEDERAADKDAIGPHVLTSSRNSLKWRVKKTRTPRTLPKVGGVVIPEVLNLAPLNSVFETPNTLCSLRFVAPECWAVVLSAT